MARNGTSGHRDVSLDPVAFIPDSDLVTALMSPLVTLDWWCWDNSIDALPATWLAATAAGLPWLQRFGNPALCASYSSA